MLELSFPYIEGLLDRLAATVTGDAVPDNNAKPHKLMILTPYLNIFSSAIPKIYRGEMSPS